MSGLSREEFIELGMSIPAGSVTQWASGQVAATQGRESRLETRGVNAAYLLGIRDLAQRVEQRKRELGESTALPPEAAALAERIRAEALGYWREAKRLASVAFANQPDVLAKFRTGVVTGSLIANLVKELESMIVLLREHAAAFAALGAGEAFLTRGELLLARLKQAKTRLDDACRELSASVAEHCHDKGLLYDLTRRLVRIGRLEFTLDREQAAVFNFKLIKRDRGIVSRPRLKTKADNKG